MASSSQTAISWGARLAPGSFAWLLPMEPPRPPSVREVLAFYRQQVGQGDGPRLRVDRAPPEFCWAAPIHAKRCGRSELVGSDKIRMLVTTNGCLVGQDVHSVFRSHSRKCALHLGLFCTRRKDAMHHGCHVD